MIKWFFTVVVIIFGAVSLTIGFKDRDVTDAVVGAVILTYGMSLLYLISGKPEE